MKYLTKAAIKNVYENDSDVVWYMNKNFTISIIFYLRNIELHPYTSMPHLRRDDNTRALQGPIDSTSRIITVSTRARVPKKAPKSSFIPPRRSQSNGYRSKAIPMMARRKKVSEARSSL